MITPRIDTEDAPLPKNANIIPATATKVFHGMLFSIFQWEQNLFDGSISTFEMASRPDSIAVIAIDKHKKIVTIHERQAHGKIRNNRLPGGRRDQGESVIATAKKRIT